MDFGGDIKFKGASCLQSIYKEADSNLITMMFSGGAADELFLSFDPGCFKAIVDTVARFLLTRDQAENLDSEKTAKITPDLWWSVCDEKILVDSSWNNSDFPALCISSAKERIRLSFHEEFAGEIADRCLKIQESKRLEKEVGKKKTVEHSNHEGGI